MQRHPFDPISAVLGALAVTAGVLVAARAVGDVDGGGGWWFAAVAAVVGLAILPWRGGRSAGPDVVEDLGDHGRRAVVVGEEVAGTVDLDEAVGPADVPGGQLGGDAPDGLVGGAPQVAD